MSIVKLKAEQHSISAGAIVNRSDLEKLVLGKENPDIYRGWRHNLVGQYLAKFLKNELALAYQNGELTIIEE